MWVQSQHTYQSALGWIDLGNYTEAWNELENLPPKDRIYLKLEKWPGLTILAEGCYASSKGHTDFLSHWAWALMKQNCAGDAEALLELRADHLTNKDSEFFTPRHACSARSTNLKAANWLQNAILKAMPAEPSGFVLGANELKVGAKLIAPKFPNRFRWTVIAVDRSYEFPDGEIRPAVQVTGDNGTIWPPREKLEKLMVVQ